MFAPSVAPPTPPEPRRTSQPPRDPVRTQRATARPEATARALPASFGPPTAYATLALGQTHTLAQNTARPTGTCRQAPLPAGAPAPASAQTVMYMEGGGTKPPTYVPSAEFLGDEHGIERPPAYKTMVPTVVAAAQWVPRHTVGEDAYVMQREGRQGMRGVRNTMYPDSIEEAPNGIGGRVGIPTRRTGSVSRAQNGIGGSTTTRRPDSTARAQSIGVVRGGTATRRPG
jgi:hypothetical protein